MENSGAGGFEFRGRAYRFEPAWGTWHPGYLTMEVKGKGCWLKLVAIPFRGATEPVQLPGHVWEPDDNDMAVHADTFMDGGLEIKGRLYDIWGCRIECLRYNADRHVLTLSFRLNVEQAETGGEDEVVGVVYCELRRESEMEP